MCKILLYATDSEDMKCLWKAAKALHYERPAEVVGGCAAFVEVEVPGFFNYR